jgi:hypothetical protein
MYRDCTFLAGEQKFALNKGQQKYIKRNYRERVSCKRWLEMK